MNLITWFFSSDLPVHEVVALQVEGAEVGRHNIALGRGFLLGGAEGVQHGGVLRKKKCKKIINTALCRNEGDTFS